MSPRGYRLDVRPDPTQSRGVSTSDAGTINDQNAGTADDGGANGRNDPNDDVGTQGPASTDQEPLFLREKKELRIQAPPIIP